MGTQTKYVEFNAQQGFAYNDHIREGGNNSAQTQVGLGPNGEVVVIEGKHRATSAAAGDQIPEAEGGVPGKPGHLRYQLGRNGAFETVGAEDVGPSLKDMANDPDKLAAARSGKKKP